MYIAGERGQWTDDGDKESDIEDKIRPTVSYVQNLGPEYLDQVFEAARWIFKLKSESVFEVGVILSLL